MDITRIFDILENANVQFPEKLNILASKENGEWKTYSVKEYYTITHLLSYGLISLGLKKGDRVVTISNNRPEWNFMDMALSQAGIVHVPVYPTISESDYEYILGHCEPKLLFVSDKGLYQKLLPLISKMDSIISVYSFNEIEDVKNWKEILETGKERSAELAEELEHRKNEIRPEDMVTLIYTSGTTGNPKGVILSHKNIISNVMGISKVFNFDSNDTTLSFLPISHVFERTINYYFQKNGISIYYAENMGTIAANLKEVCPTVFIAVPRVLESIYAKIIGVGKDLNWLKKHIFFAAVNLGLRFEFNRKNGRYYHFKLGLADKLVFKKWREAVGNNVKLIVVGGAAMQPRLIRIFNAAKIPVVEGYGMTETSPVIATNNYDSGEVMIGTVGPALPGVNIKISDDGEILVKGDIVMTGYYKEPELTKESFDGDGWFHTGDVGILEENKYLKITDRKKEMFKLSSGKYIAPQVIENKMKESFFIEQAMVIGENQKFASALISPNFQFLHNWCAMHGVKYRDNQELINDPKVIVRYQKEINDINDTLGQTEQIKRFRLVLDEWTQQNGQLSPTLKLKRRFLYEEYKDIIDEIFSSQKNGIN